MRKAIPMGEGLIQEPVRGTKKHNTFYKQENK